MSDYNAAFVTALQRDMCGRTDAVRKRAAELVHSREVDRLFPEHDAIWLQKELSKWRKRLSDESFNGTLQSLQLYCTLMGSNPNDVLLPQGVYSGPKRVELLSWDTILDLAETIRKNRVILRQGFALPILYSPGRMTAVFLFLHSQRRGGTDAVILRFGLSEPEGYADAEGNDYTGGIQTALDSGHYAVELTLEDWETRLHGAYGKIVSEFEAVCAATEGPLEDALNDFYGVMGEWTDRNCECGELLFSWYPPDKRKHKPADLQTRLDIVLKKYDLSERER